jgi:hypothetical protein
MRMVKYMVTACGLSALFLSAVIAHAVLAPLPEKAPQQDQAWTTTIYKNTF